MQQSPDRPQRRSHHASRAASEPAASSPARAVPGILNLKATSYPPQLPPISIPQSCSAHPSSALLVQLPGSHSAPLLAP